jgi:hypothetical protein
MENKSYKCLVISYILKRKKIRQLQYHIAEFEVMEKAKNYCNSTIENCKI